jgi:hypothetical protein
MVMGLEPKKNKGIIRKILKERAFDWRGLWFGEIKEKKRIRKKSKWKPNFRRRWNKKK